MFEYCVTCELNHQQGKQQHNRTPAHQKSLLTFVETLQQHIREQHSKLANPIPFADLPAKDRQTNPARRFWCAICEQEICDNDQPFYGHLAGKKHENSVDQFIKDYLTNALKKRFKKKHFRLTQGAFEKYLEKTKEYQLQPQEDSPAPSDFISPVLPITESPLPSEINHPPPIIESYAGDNDNRLPHIALQDPEPRIFKSSDGIIQNASGWYQGSRVWGGGIVKIPPSEWQPWFVDLDPERNSQITKNQNQTRENPNTIHDATIHPWQRGKQDFSDVREEIKILVAKANQISLAKRNKNPKRHRAFCADEVSNKKKRVFLPNFGGVWESGPRSRTAFNFYDSNKTSLGKK